MDKKKKECEHGKGGQTLEALRYSTSHFIKFRFKATKMIEVSAMVSDGFWHKQAASTELPHRRPRRRPVNCLDSRFRKV